jgi:hypothetical protein
LKSQPSYFQKSDTHDIEITCVKDVAKFLKRSPSWIYKNFQELGGVKVGGSVLFPAKEKIYERLFKQKEEMVRVLLPVQKEAVHKGRFQKEKGGPGSRGRKEKRSKNTKENGVNRHGIFNLA